jgi:hypothetical protein
MKPLAPDLGCPVWAVLPPLLVERIHRHYNLLYGEELTASNALAEFCSEFITDAEFRERVQTRAYELQSIVFDSRDPSWGLWPVDPEECAGIGFFLGLVLENSIDDYVADLPEPTLALLEAQVVSSGRSLEEIFIEMLIEAKSLAAYTVD